MDVSACVCVSQKMLHLIKLEGIPFQLKRLGVEGRMKGREENGVKVMRLK